MSELQISGELISQDKYDELESAYEDGLVAGDYPKPVVEYVEVLEQRLEQARSEVYKLNSQVMLLEDKVNSHEFAGDKCLSQYNLRVGLNDAVSNVVAKVFHEQERILKRELVKYGVDIDNHSEVIKRCKKITYGDGSVQYIIDDKIVIRFGGMQNHADAYRVAESLGPIMFGANFNYSVTHIKPGDVNA